MFAALATLLICGTGTPIKTYVFDCETTNLRSDIGTLLVASFGEMKPDGTLKPIETEDIKSMGSERELAAWIWGKFVDGDIFIGHNSVAFDRNFLNGVLTRLGMNRLPYRWHLDTMQIAKGKFLYQSVSLENLADVFKVGTKDKPAKSDWREANILDEAAIGRLRKRCESDVKITAAVFNSLKPIWHERYGR